MKRIMSALALVSVAALTAVGCGGDDDDSSTTNGGTSSAAGAPANAGGDNGSTSAGASNLPLAGAPGSGNVMCDPSQKGVCQNDTDCPFVVDGTARITAGSCGQGCIGKASNCSRDCIVEKLSMTSDCASCYADTVNCTIKNCLGECLADPEAPDCKQCQVDKGCRAAFDACSGLPG